MKTHSTTLDPGRVSFVFFLFFLPIWILSHLIIRFSPVFIPLIAAQVLCRSVGLINIISSTKIDSFSLREREREGEQPLPNPTRPVVNQIWVRLLFSVKKNGRNKESWPQKLGNPWFHYRKIGMWGGDPKDRESHGFTMKRKNVGSWPKS